jgi:amidophosphoribosyltransferase
VAIEANNFLSLSAPGKKLKICSFLWTYYGYPTATYEGINVEAMRYRCGALLYKRDN